MKKYLSSTLFPKRGDEKKLIEGTVFFGGILEEVFHSCKNTKISPFTGKASMTLSYKIGLSISKSQSNDFNVFRGESKEGEFFLGTFDGGSKNGKEFFLLNFDKEEFIATNMYSHLIMKMMIAVERFKNPTDELDKYFRMIDFEADVIDSDQKKQFFIAADAIYYASSSSFINKDFSETNDIDDYKEYIPYIKDDITAFVQNDYDGTMKEAASELGIDGNIVNIIKPIVSEKPMSVKEKIEKMKTLYWNGVETFTKEQIEAMPALLKNGYELAKRSFIENRDFWGKEEWELVDAIAVGDVRSINMTGPAGTGKTTTIRSIAGALGLPFVLVGGSANIEEADLLGTRNVEAIDGTSVTTWTDGPITMAIRYGGFLLFDEVNAADPGILMKLNTILDGSKSLILSTSEEVKVHKNFIYSEAMNVGAAYAGTDQMNQSHFDRMDEMIKVSAKTVAEEAKILAANTGYEDFTNLEKVCEIKRSILALINAEGDASEQICSIRRLICWIKKAKRTGEFIDSSLSTVIAHLTVYDDSFEKLTKEDVLESSGIASKVMEIIIDAFEDVSY